MSWVDVGPADGGDGTLREARAGDRLLGVANAGGRWRVFDAYCTHAECLLTDGWLEGAAVRCACHAALFDLETGTALDGPADVPIGVYETRVARGRVEAELPAWGCGVREHTVRPLTSGDAEGASDVLRELERSLGYPGVSTPAQLLDWWRHTELADRSWAIEEDGRLVAFAWLLAHGDVAQVDGVVAPLAHGRGLGSRLCDLLEEKAGELGLATVHQHGLAADIAARVLFETRGYREARRFYEMAIELDAPPPEPSWPEGIVPRPFRPDDARAFHDAIAESFREEWGFVALPFEEWKRLRVDEADTSLYVVAIDDREIAGFIRAETRDSSSGFVGMLGVRPAWRQRGLGRALLLHALRAFHDRGVRHVSLDVDSDNPTGATRLYESVGMTVQVAVVVYERALDRVDPIARPG